MDGTFTGNLKQHCQMILRNSRRLLGLINQILELSKLESGKLKLQASAVEIISFTNSLCQTFESLASMRNINLNFAAEPARQTVHLDPEKYETVINNLLSNAFKATSEGGEIDVEIRYARYKPQAAGGIDETDRIMDQDRTDKNAYIQILVSNTGLGVPSDQLDNIFDRFYQAENAYKKNEEGTGIGLALVRELIELHHGKICVESNPEAKTTFSIMLPLGKNHLRKDELTDTIQSKVIYQRPIPDDLMSDLEESNAKKVDFHHPKVTILLVEDNDDLRRYICFNMDHRYSIIEAENGKEAFNLATEKSPELIISDVMMPVMDGFELCARIKADERTSHIPVILLTARAGQEDKIEGLETEADDYMTKPFDIRELKVRVKNLIEQRRKLREKFIADTNFAIENMAFTSVDKNFINRLTNIISDHISDSDFHVETMSSEIGLSRTHLYRKIIGLTGQSPGTFLRTIRLKQGALLLKRRTGNISEIAYQVGFKNPANFSACFRRQFGISPSEYSKQSSK
jgi:DNA-binding response OmpR family regulator/two-component sensor histidine kinase